MKTKERKTIQSIDHRGNSPQVIRKYNLEIELVHNINKKTPSYSFND